MSQSALKTDAPDDDVLEMEEGWKKKKGRGQSKGSVGVDEQKKEEDIKMGETRLKKIEKKVEKEKKSKGDDDMKKMWYDIFRYVGSDYNSEDDEDYIYEDNEDDEDDEDDENDENDESECNEDEIDELEYNEDEESINYKYVAKKNRTEDGVEDVYCLGEDNDKRKKGKKSVMAKREEDNDNVPCKRSRKGKIIETSISRMREQMKEMGTLTAGRNNYCYMVGNVLTINKCPPLCRLFEEAFGLTTSSGDVAIVLEALKQRKKNTIVEQIVKSFAQRRNTPTKEEKEKKGKENKKVKDKWPANEQHDFAEALLYMKEDVIEDVNSKRKIEAEKNAHKGNVGDENDGTKEDESEMSEVVFADAESELNAAVGGTWDILNSCNHCGKTNLTDEKEEQDGKAKLPRESFFFYPVSLAYASITSAILAQSEDFVDYTLKCSSCEKEDEEKEEEEKEAENNEENVKKDMEKEIVGSNVLENESIENEVKSTELYGVGKKTKESKGRKKMGMQKNTAEKKTVEVSGMEKESEGENEPKKTKIKGIPRRCDSIYKDS